MYTPKKIIICCDGTWNKPETQFKSDEKPTNVLKIMRLIPSVDDKGRHQVTFYDPGVGTDRGIYDKYVGGALGLGLSGHVKKAYRFVANNYITLKTADGTSGDELYFFGFSRGAYTARVVAAFISTVGLLQSKDMQWLPVAYKYYRTPPEKRPTSRFHSQIQSLKRIIPKIKFIGVWDTVGALGIPIPVLRLLSKRRVGFFDNALRANVQYAYHALAIDERRRPFSPDLWSEVVKNEQIEYETQDICQTWFVGAHSDTGGGYSDNRLSDIACKWMIKRAQACDLAFNTKYLDDKTHLNPQVNGKMRDSFSLFYKLLRFAGVKPYVRSIGPKQTDKLKPQPGLNEMLHESVIERLDTDPNYTPENVLKARETLPIFRENSYTPRAYPREPVSWEGALRFGDEAVDCKVLDFNKTGGAKIQCSASPKIRTSTQLSWLNTGPLNGEVVWHDHQNSLIGIRFVA